jgi:hypothetical protein
MTGDSRGNLSSRQPTERAKLLMDVGTILSQNCLVVAVAAAACTFTFWPHESTESIYSILAALKISVRDGCSGDEKS